MSFISLTSSTFLFHRWHNQPLLAFHEGTLDPLDGNKVLTGSVRTSMNVRRQLFLQKLQRVASLRVLRYSILRTRLQADECRLLAITPQPQ